MHRTIEGLKWASARANGPFSAPRARKGAKGYGIRYERELARELPLAKHGQWWEFEDRRGRGWCQTDFLLELPDAMVVLEAKYSWVGEGHTQLENLYRPVVEHATGKRMAGIVVCKNLVSGLRVHVTGSFNEALEVALANRPVVLHWIAGPLLPTLSAKPLVPSTLARAI